jgi:2,5-dihydroxypyridine 5,6-dioxygenase
MMDLSLSSADLVAMFEAELRMCKVKAGETVLIFTDPRYPHQAYPPAAFAAARSLGANVYLMVAQGDQDLEDKTVRAAWQNADMILGMSTIPRGIGSWMYTDTHNAALKAGARVLMIQEPLEVLRRMLPTPETRRRGLAGAKRLQEAREIHVTSRAGSDFTLRKDGRKGMYQGGVADEPGRWDHWPSGLVTCAPLEDSAEGIYVIEPGDAMLFPGDWRHARNRVTITFDKGRLAKIEGGQDAYLLQAYLERIGDEGAFRLSHAGWGIEDRTDWGHVGIDSESMYGTVMVSIGRNIFDAPAAYSGLGGKNTSNAHFDICCRNASLYLDGELIVENEVFAVKELG